MAKLIARLLLLAFIAGGTANLAHAQQRFDFLKAIPIGTSLSELWQEHTDLYLRLIDVLVEPDDYQILLLIFFDKEALVRLQRLPGDTLQQRKERMRQLLGLKGDFHVESLRYHLNRFPPCPAPPQTDAQPAHLPTVTQRELNAANCMTGAQLVRHLNGIMEETEGGHHDNNAVAEGNGVDHTSLQLIRTIIAELPAPTTTVVAALLMFAVRSKHAGS